MTSGEPGYTDQSALTSRQEAFAQAYVKLGNGAEAHRQAYPTCRYGQGSRRGVQTGALRKRAERARELLMHPKVARRIIELAPCRIAELTAEPSNSDALSLAQKLRTKLEQIQSHAASIPTRAVCKRPGSSSGAQTAVRDLSNAEQIAELVHIAAREDMPAPVRREALAAVLPHIEAMLQALGIE